MTANILAVYEATSAEDIAAGLTWYRDAWDIARAIMPNDPVRGAAIIAATSPALGWDANVRAAIAAARPRTRRPAGVIGDGWAKAKCIAKGADPWAVLGGPKVRAFFANIAGDTQAVTVDRHAVAIALGVFIDGKTYQRVVAGHRYEAIADAYRAAAAVVGIDPREIQAVTWVHWRRTPWRERPAA